MNTNDLIADLQDRLNRGEAARRLLAVVAEMRAAQTGYFKIRTAERLQACKQLEKAVDAGIAKLRRTK